MSDPTAAPPPSKAKVFARRLTSTAILWGVVLAAMFSGNKLISDYVFLLFMVALACVGLIEFYGLVEKRGLVCFRYWGIAAGVLLMIGTFLHLRGQLGIHGSPSRVNDFETSFLILFVLGLCVRQFVSQSNTAGILAISTTLFGLMYVPWLLNFIQKINFFPGINDNGKYYVLYFILVTKFSDSGAYAVGSLIGKHKMIPRISPAKTWEGFGGAIVVATGASLAYTHFLADKMPGMTPLHAIILGVVLSSAAVIGDLIESLFKREAGVKDSGNFFPGIGGILDLLDSLLFNAPIMYLYLRHVLTHCNITMKNVVVLGSTGSIGTSTIKVAEDLPDRIRLLALAAGNNAELLVEQTRKHRPVAVSINDLAKANELRGTLGANCEVYSGADGLVKLATLPGADIVLIAIVGTAGLQPALAAIRAGKDIAIASKEILVMAGETVMSEARKYGVRVLAVDSEHSAIFQCLDGKPPASVRKLWLTASGGPFRDKLAWSKEKFAEITVEKALKHPSWVMGRKITIDSATLFNKGLEMIEARWLFDIEMARVGVVVHPQSIVHSMVEFVDGSLLAQLSTPDMCLPIQYALTYPDRAASDRVQTDFPKLGSLTFEEPDVERFPALELARRAGEVGGTLPAVLNAANEVAVEAFVNRKINFPQITEVVRRTMDAHQIVAQPSLEQILTADVWARREAAR